MTILLSNMTESMKTRNIALIFLASAALMLSACANEPEIENGEDITFDKDESMFKIGSVQTRAADEFESTTHEVASVTTDNGDTFVLQETVTSLDDVYTSSPETRGTPAFTQNVKQVYGSFYTYAMKEGGSAAFAKTQQAGFPGVEYTLKVENQDDPSENIWHYHYGEDIWGEGKLPTYFFMRMPGKNDGVTLGNNPYSWNDGSITFSYTTPATAPEQKDILFASYKRTAETNAEKVTFYHALTGVKFANFFDYSLKEGAYAKAETIIKNIKISGLKNTGTCKVTPDPTKHSYDQGVVVWSGLDGSGTYSQDIDYDFAKYRTDLFPEGTLNSTASKQNLNKNDGSLTFFFIPQTLTSDVTIEVTFDVSLRKLENGSFTTPEKTFENVKFTFKLAEKLNANHLTWKAGELHTFTLWPRAIGVKIADTMNEAKDKKSAVVVKNTGNTWQYVRVNLIGNWVGQVQKSGHADDLSNPTILMGYSNATYADGYDGTTLPPRYANEIETAPWNDKDGYTNYGHFVNLTPKSKTDNPTVVNNWVRFDKYYYYTKAIGPNDAITEPLFDSYTVYTSPEFWIPDIQGYRRQAKGVHLEMDLMVEAIEAPTNAAGKLIYADNGAVIPGTTTAEQAAATDGYIRAWVAALGLQNAGQLDDLK